MEIDDVVEMSVTDFFNMVKDEGGTYQIETDEGFSSLGSLISKKDKKCFRVELTNGMFLEASEDHYLMVDIEDDRVKRGNRSPS